MIENSTNFSLIMKTHRLRLDDIFEEDFQVIAIYCHEQDFRLAFLLNTHLGIQLCKATSILDQKIGANFHVFEFLDKTFYRNWFLLNNHSILEKEVNNNHDLFAQNTTLFHQKVFYIKELKRAAFLLKIEADENIDYYNDLVKKIEQIPQVYAVELIHLTRLKNKKLLIF